jgi:hypothetical protein
MSWTRTFDTGMDGTLSVIYGLGTGTVSGSTTTSFTPLPGGPVIVNTLNLNTGAWVAVCQGSGTLASGTLTSAQITGTLAALQETEAQIRDVMDSFACTGGLGAFIPGSQTSTW